MIIVKGEVIPITCSDPDCTHCPGYQVIVTECDPRTGVEEPVYVSEVMKDQAQADQLAKVKAGIWMEGLRRAHQPEGIVYKSPWGVH